MLSLANKSNLGSESHGYHNLILMSDVYDALSQVVHKAYSTRTHAMQRIWKEAVVL
jgi:hypothetical protein